MKLVSWKEQVFQETPIGRLPKDWKIAGIGDVVEINGRSIDPEKELADSEFNYIDIESVEGGSGVIKSPKKLLGKGAPSRARRLVLENDVIMSTVRPYLKAFALIPKEYDGQICSTGFAVLTCRKEIMPYYLFSTLFSEIVISQCNRMMVGGQYPALNSSQVSNIVIPLPPLSEQGGISEVLSVANSVIQKTSEIIAKTERLKKGLMQKLLTEGIGNKEFRDTEIGKMPREWEIKTLSDVFKLSSGKPRPAQISEEATEPSPYPIYGGNGVLGYADEYSIDKETIVIGRVGEYCGAIHKTPQYSWITDNALYATELVSSFQIDFLFYLLGFLELNRLKKKMGQPLLTQAIIYKIRIQCPPLVEQAKIAEFLCSIDEKLRLERKERKKLERIKQGLMDLLLSGKVRVKVD